MTDTPARLEPLLDFANTIDVEAQHDDFQKVDDFAPPGEPAVEAMRAWLVEHALLVPGDTVDAAGYDVVISLRAALRELFMANHERAQAPAALARLNEIAVAAPLVVRLGRDASTLEPASTGIHGAAARLLALVHAAVADGTWPRLKLCRADTCQWAYFDASKNRSRNWCSMDVCGNRAKVRAYQARRRSGAPQ